MLENLVLLAALVIPLTIGIIVVTYKTVRESIDQDYADQQKMKRDRQRF